MAIILIVEDGTGVAGANAYDTLAEARIIAESQGVKLPVDNDEANSFLVQSTWQLESYRECYSGVKTHGRAQPLQYPRSGVYIDGEQIASNEIPIELKQAWVIMGAAVAAGEYINSTNPVDNGGVQKEKVDVLEVTYFAPTNANAHVTVTQAENFLQPLFGTCDDTGFTFNVVRA